MTGEVLDWFGLGRGTDVTYLLDSGLLPCALGLGTVIAWWRRHECHVNTCHRWAKHPVADGTYIVCAKHHPGVPNEGPSATHIEIAHQKAKEK